MPNEKYESPIRIQRKRTKGFNLQDASPNGLPVVFVGRPTKWGNPFKIGCYYKWGDPEGAKGWIAMLYHEKLEAPFQGYTLIENAQMAVDWFVELQKKFPSKTEELRGKNLACWCEKGKPCHADVLLKMANK